MAMIVVDPGHGGAQDLLGSSANNAVGPAGTLEKDLTLDVAQRLAQRLTEAGHSVQLTRMQDVNLSAADRAAVGKQASAQAFVSIHFNQAQDPGTQGTEVLVRPSSPDSMATLDEGSRRLAESIRAQVVAALGLPDLGLRPGPWAILAQRLHTPGTARCLVEVSFLSDAAEESRLLDEAYRDTIADALALGIGAAVGTDVAAAQPQMRAIGGVRGRAPAPFRPPPRPAPVAPRRPYGRVMPRGTARALQQATDWCLIRHNIIRSAVEMQGAWLDDAYNLRQESSPHVLEHLEAFWRDGVGSGNWQAVAGESANNVTPWSAAFVSWTMRNAGVTAAMGFDFSGRHMDYIAEALRNRMRADQNRPFWFYGIGEQAANPLYPGDLICMNRPFNGVMTNHTLEGLQRRFWGEDGENVNADTTGASHCDVAIGYQTNDAGQRFIEVIGGNRGHHEGPNAHTVGSALLEVDAAGQLTNPGAHNIFGFVKLTECQRVL